MIGQVGAAGEYCSLAVSWLLDVGPFGLWLIVGLPIWVVIFSMTESASHQWIQHGSAAAQRRWKGWGALGRALQVAQISHTRIHHHATYGRNDHVTQFGSEIERAELTAKLRAQGHQHIIADGYGVSLTTLGMARFLRPFVCVYLAAASLGFAAGAPLVFIVAGVPAIALFPAGSRWLHPQLHMSCEERQARLPRFASKFLSTRFGEYLLARHFIHHRRAKDAHGRRGEEFNFNVIPPGDILRGKSRGPCPEELCEMRALGLIAPVH